MSGAGYTPPEIILVNLLDGFCADVSWDTYRTMSTHLRVSSEAASSGGNAV